MVLMVGFVVELVGEHVFKVFDILEFILICSSLAAGFSFRAAEVSSKKI